MNLFNLQWTTRLIKSDLNSLQEEIMKAIIDMQRTLSSQAIRSFMRFFIEKFIISRELVL